jgi:putative ABC transport system ATP-binding protein
VVPTLLEGVRPVAKLSAVSKTYRGRRPIRALRDITLAIGRSEVTAVVGPSGSGKSTLLSVLGLMETFSGEYFLDGLDISGFGFRDLARLRRTKIGFIFQFFHLVDDITAEENVALPLVYNGIGKKTRQALTRDALERVGMMPPLNVFPSELSGGEQQRVAIARAIVHRPTLIIADEPTGNLDSANGAAVRDLLLDMRVSGSTVIIATHDIALARTADRIISLRDGEIVDDHVNSIVGRLLESSCSH